MIDLLKNRTVQIAAQAVVITGLVGGTGAVITMNKPLTLTVNGESEQVRSFGGTVGDILENRDITIEKHDEVKPGLDANVTREMSIEVNTAKTIDLNVDGVSTEKWSTANTVGQALADLGVDARNAALIADEEKATVESKLTDGDHTIDVVTAKDLTVIDGKKKLPVSAAVGTAGQALSEAGLTLDDNDFLSVPTSSAVTSGQVLTVMRVEVKTKTKKETIEAKTETKKSSKLYVGETKTEKKAKDGTKEVVYKVKTVNGDTVKKDKQKEKVLTKPVSGLVLEGTKKKPTNTGGDSGDGGDGGDSGTGGGDGSDSGNTGGGGGSMTTAEIKAMLGGPGTRWYNLVKCESNFNPRASNGTHFGLFQFSQQTWNGIGGSGDPRDASPQEQFKRAKMLQERSGWSQWSCA